MRLKKVIEQVVFNAKVNTDVIKAALVEHWEAIEELLCDVKELKASIAILSAERHDEEVRRKFVEDFLLDDIKTSTPIEAANRMKSDIEFRSKHERK